MGPTDRLGGKGSTPGESSKKPRSDEEAVNESGGDCGVWVPTEDQRRQGLEWAAELRKASWRRMLGGS